MLNDAKSLEAKTVDQLKALAKESNVKGYAQMNKAKLIEALSVEQKHEMCPVTDEPCKKSCDPDFCGDHKIEQQKSSCVKSDLDNHPKFDKFKSIQGAE